MSTIQNLKTYFTSYSGLTGTNSPILTDFLGALPTQYAIIPLPGQRIVATYLNDKKQKEYPFAFQSIEYTADELERMDVNAFYEALGDWLDSQSEAEVLPTLDAGKTAEKIEALGWGYLLDDGDSGTGVYQIQCKLTYEQS